MSRGSRVWVLFYLLRVRTYRPIPPSAGPAIDFRSWASVCCLLAGVISKLSVFLLDVAMRLICAVFFPQCANDVPMKCR
eukprot:8042954-Ditylum_brightwellii.AAC.1